MTASGSLTQAPSRKPIPGSPWTDQETGHLIDAYEEKWCSLKRGQLKAQQWEEVSAEVASRCGFVNPSKNGTQCRHKIEKLRKRYRSERLRPVRSSWSFFDRMDRMERGPVPISALQAYSDEDDDEDEDSAEPHRSNTRSINGILREASPWDDSRASRSIVKRKRGDEEEDDEDEGEDSEEGEDCGEMAEELRRFGEGYVRMERRRMEIMREIEREWMEMEAKRMEMIMEAQRGVMETIAVAFSKKTKSSVNI